MNTLVRKMLVATTVFGITMNDNKDGFGGLVWAPDLLKETGATVGPKMIRSGLHYFVISCCWR
jgi:hypothetical protein